MVLSADLAHGHHSHYLLESYSSLSHGYDIMHISYYVTNQLHLHKFSEHCEVFALKLLPKILHHQLFVHTWIQIFCYNILILVHFLTCNLHTFWIDDNRNLVKVQYNLEPENLGEWGFSPLVTVSLWCSKFEPIIMLWT